MSMTKESIEKGVFRDGESGKETMRKIICFPEN